MRYASGLLVFSPTDLVRFLENPFLTWMDRQYLEDPSSSTPDPVPEAQQLIRQTAMEREQAVVDGLIRQGHDVYDVRGDVTLASMAQRHEATLAAMMEGREFIVQGELRGGSFAGIADFLHRVDLPAKASSRLGAHAYEAWDAKLARRVKPGHVIQLCAYAEMLAELQGHWPDEIAVVLGSGTIERFPTRDYRALYGSTRDAFLRQQATWDPRQMPDPMAAGRNERWESEAARWLEARDHLSLVAGITQTQVRRLEAAGISTRQELSTTERPHIPRLAPAVLKRLRHQAALQIRSEGRERPVYEVLDPTEWPSDRTSAEDLRRGLRLLPPASPGDVVFDIEGDPFVDGGLEYLFGLVHLDESGARVFLDFWAHDRKGEREAFEALVDWLQERWRSFPDFHVYHYAPYEVSAMRRLASAHGTREEEVDEFLRGELFVDLYRVVQQGVRIGVPSYSLKQVEHLYRDRRDGEVSTAVDSVVRYEEWLEVRDGDDWRSSDILRGIREYNRDDCESTWDLLEWLRQRQTEAGQDWSPPRDLDGSITTKDSAKREELPNAVLAEALLAELPELPELPKLSGEGEDSGGRGVGALETRRVHELIAHLLEFHRREAKPVFWALFERESMTEDQLYDDLECLAGLERTSDPPRPDKRSMLFSYAFDPKQDTKLRTKAYFAHDLSVDVEIRGLDRDIGRLDLRLGPKALSALESAEPPQRLSLLPNEFVSAGSLESALLEVGNGYLTERTLSPALQTLFYRQPPSLRGASPGQDVLPPGVDLVEGAIDAVLRMEDTTLCIQGPPGTGKTYTGAKIILALLRAGHRVGITANSHKAIENLLHRVVELGREFSGELDFSAAKVGGESDEAASQYEEVVRCTRVEDAPEANLIGGTAWAFTRPAARGRFDYLFIDEAGQVSLANLTAVSTSARNLVLLGDQMQLSQPTRARHPGESGQSCLDYLLHDHPTIPPQMGIFLSESWRLHPDLCSFISDAIYEGRLTARPEAAEREILRADDAEVVSRGTGLMYLPVWHEGNTQGSDEEVEAVAELVDELLGSRLRTGDSDAQVRPLTLHDILVVAPYNLQVHRLRERLGPKARVGTIDKFQGQEAPVSIVTMCASSGEASPRGIDFLFDLHRLNVALSRAQCLAVVVGHPHLAQTPCSTTAHMRQVNLFCRIVEFDRLERASSPV